MTPFTRGEFVTVTYPNGSFTAMVGLVGQAGIILLFLSTIEDWGGSATAYERDGQWTFYDGTPVMIARSHPHEE